MAIWWLWSGTPREPTPVRSRAARRPASMRTGRGSTPSVWSADRSSRFGLRLMPWAGCGNSVSWQLRRREEVGGRKRGSDRRVTQWKMGLRLVTKTRGGSSVYRVGLVVVTLVISVASAALGNPWSEARAQEATPAASCPATSEVENEAVARRWYEDALNNADLSVLDEILSPD